MIVSNKLIKAYTFSTHNIVASLVFKSNYSKLNIFTLFIPMESNT